MTEKQNLLAVLLAKELPNWQIFWAERTSQQIAAQIPMCELFARHSTSGRIWSTIYVSGIESWEVQALAAEFLSHLPQQ